MFVKLHLKSPATGEYLQGHSRSMEMAAIDSGVVLLSSTSPCSQCADK